MGKEKSEAEGPPATPQRGPLLQAARHSERPSGSRSKIGRLSGHGTRSVAPNTPTTPSLANITAVQVWPPSLLAAWTSHEADHPSQTDIVRPSVVSACHTIPSTRCPQSCWALIPCSNSERPFSHSIPLLTSTAFQSLLSTSSSALHLGAA